MNGKFEVLHIFEVVFEFLLSFDKCFCTFGHGLFERRIFGCTFFFRYTLQCSPAARSFECDLLGGAYTGNYVFSLCIDEVLSVKDIFAGSSVTSECYTGSRGISHIAEYHSLHVYGSTPFFGNLVHTTVENGAFVHPAVEYGTDSTP